MSGDRLDLDVMEVRAKQAVEWGIVYDNPEGILALITEVRALLADREMGRTNLAHYSDIIDAQAGENDQLRAAVQFKQGIIDDLAATVARLEAQE